MGGADTHLGGECPSNGGRSHRHIGARPGGYREKGGYSMTASSAEPEAFPIPPEADAFWQFDRVHAPRPLTPLSQDLLLPAFGEGMNAGLDEIGYPHKFAMRSVNNFAYLGIISSPAHGEALD